MLGSSQPLHEAASELAFRLLDLVPVKGTGAIFVSDTARAESPSCVARDVQVKACGCSFSAS